MSLLPPRTRALLVTLVAALVAGCAPAPPSLPSLPPAAEPAAITFALPDHMSTAFATLADRFHAEHPDVRVRVVPLPQGADGGPGDLRAAAERADAALVPSRLVQVTPAPAGLLRDLGPLMDADPTFDRADLYPGALLRDPADGRVVALQQSVAPPLLYYNRDLFRAAGVAEPQPGWSWAEILAAAEAVARPDDVAPTYGLMGAWGGLDEPLAALFAEAGLDLGADPATLDLGSPAAAAALGRLADLVRVGAVYQHPSADQQVDSGEITRLIGEGRVGMWLQDVLVGPREPWFAVATYPPLPLPGDVPLFSFVVSAGSARPEAAWRWVSFLSRQEIDLTGALSLGAVAAMPARRSVTDAGDFWARLEERAGAATVAAVRAALELPAPEGLAGQPLRLALHKAAANVAARRQTPAEALAEASQRMADIARELSALAEQRDEPVVVSPPPAPAAPPPGAAAITFVTADDARAYSLLAEQFHREHPDIFVSVRQWQFPPGGGSMSLGDLATGADCFSWGAAPSGADLGLVRDLGPLMDADPRFSRDDFPAVLRDAFAVDGALYALPHYFRPTLLHYNRDLFVAAGLPEPHAGWSLDDMLAAAQALTDRQAGQYGFATIGYQPGDLFYMLDRFDARPLAGQEGRPVSFTEPRTLAALQFYRDLLQTSAPFQRLDGYEAWDEPPSGWDLVAAGKVAMWFDDTRRGPAAEAPAFSYAVAPRPFGAGPATGLDLNELGGLLITAASPHPEACWRWISFLSGQSAQLTDPGLFPARYSTANDAFWQARSPGAPEVYAAYRAAFERGLLAGGGEALMASGVDLFWLHRAVDRALRGENLVRELELAEERTSMFLGCRAAGTDGLTCARQVDPDYNGILLMFPPQTGHP